MGLKPHQVIVFISGYVVYGLSIGFLYGLGAIFPVIMDTFNTTRTETSIIPSMYAAFTPGGGIVYGIVTSKFGPMKSAMLGSLVTSLSMIVSFWATSLSYLIATSVTTACGLGMCFVACTAGVRPLFEGKSSVIALALMSSSSGTTGVAFTYILQYLSDIYGLRGTLLVIGGLELHGAVLCLLWKPRVGKGSRINNGPEGKGVHDSMHIHNIKDSKMTNSDIPDHLQYASDSTSTQARVSDVTTELTNEPITYINEGYISEKGSNLETVHDIASSKDTKYTFHNRVFVESVANKPSIKFKLKHLLRNHSLTFTVIAMVLCFSSLNQYAMFLVDMYMDRGYSRLEGAAGLTIMNIIAIFGRASPAAIAKSKFYNTFLLPISSTILVSIAMFLLTVVDSIGLCNILAGIIGFGLGVAVSVLVVSVSELVEPEYLAEAVGFIMSINGMFALIGGPITGYLRDLTGSYTLSQILTSVFTALGSAVFIAAACFQKKKVKNLEKKKRSSLFYITKR